MHCVHDIRVIEGENGLFVAMPSKKMPNGGFRDIAHPIHADMRKQMKILSSRHIKKH